MASLLYKFYCRSVQKVFWVGVHFLRWREPELLMGAGSLQKLPAKLHENRITKILIVTDEFLAQTEHFENLQNILKQSGIEFFIYDKTIPNPTLENIEDALKIYKARKCNALLAFGGGSAIDCAKGVGIRIARPHTPLRFLKGMLKVLRSIPYLIAIPTTAGTGSETTVAAVISDPKTHSKYPINDLHLIPKLAVLDADITRALPPHLTATTGMDALTHAIEAFIGGSNFGGSAEAAIEAGKLIFEYLPQAYSEGSNTLAREKMQKAAYLAGFAFTRAYVGYVHAVAHSLGGMYRTPHGLANAIILPHVLERYGKHAEKRLALFAKETNLVPQNTSAKDAAQKLIEKIRSMNAQMNIPEFTPVEEKDIPELARAACAEANPFYPVPCIFNKRELEEIYRIISKKPSNA